MLHHVVQHLAHHRRRQQQQAVLPLPRAAAAAAATPPRRAVARRADLVHRHAHAPGRNVCNGTQPYLFSAPSRTASGQDPLRKETTMSKPCACAVGCRAPPARV